MRHLVLALMIFLLPLRGWMGDAMATDMAIDMATGLVSATKTIAASAYKTSLNDQFEYKSASYVAPTSAVQVHPDCGGHASASVEAVLSQDTHDAQDGHCTPCQSCQACHTVALSPPVAKSMAIFNFKGQPDAAALPFVNADAALSKKPPIS